MGGNDNEAKHNEKTRMAVRVSDCDIGLVIFHYVGKDL